MRLHMISESRQVNEDLGNLSKLNLGNLAGLLKQDGYRGVSNKFQKGPYSSPGNTSEIIDAGPLNKGITGLRKAYRAAQSREEKGNVPIVGFAVYLNNKTVAFGLYGSDELAGRTREGKFAYDLRGFEAQIDAAHEKENTGRHQYNQTRKIDSTSAYDKEDREYPHGYGKEAQTVIRKFVGSSRSTADLAAFLETLTTIADLIDGTLTLKLVTADRQGSERGQSRRMAAPTPFDMREAGRDLKARLARFKNAKRPTAENIHQFLEMAVNKAASVVNFGGNSWSTNAGIGYQTNIDPVKLMNGMPFSIEYKSAEPGSYATLKISYRYDKRDNMIRPWQAQWSDKESKSKVVVMDPEFWIQDRLKISDLEKPTVIKKMLTMIKENPGTTTFGTIETAIKAMRDLGHDWPEFGIIEKSIAAERAKAS